MVIDKRITMHSVRVEIRVQNLPRSAGGSASGEQQFSVFQMAAQIHPAEEELDLPQGCHDIACR
jgi:hypothetical protein